MALASFTLMVSYSQIAVFESALANPFSLWTPRHVDQGFAWRSGSTSFRTFESGGPHLVEIVETSKDSELAPESVRVIEVPFEVPASDPVEIASITEGFAVKVPAGLYSLRFECFRADPSVRPMVKFSFIKKNRPTFRVLRADGELNLTGELVTSASPA